MSVHDLRNHIRLCETQTNYAYVLLKNSDSSYNAGQEHELPDMSLLQNSDSSYNAREEQELPDMSLSVFNYNQNDEGQNFQQPRTVYWD